MQTSLNVIKNGTDDINENNLNVIETNKNNMDDINKSAINENDINTGDIKENSTNNTNIKEGINYKILTDDASIKLIKLISSFKQIILNSLEKNEPSIITRYSIDVAKAYGVFYDKNKIISDDQESQNARLYLTYMTKVTLENSLKLLGIEVPNKM